MTREEMYFKYHGNTEEDNTWVRNQCLISMDEWAKEFGVWLNTQTIGFKLRYSMNELYDIFITKTRKEREKLDAYFEERTKYEKMFLKNNDAEVNEHGVYVYQTQNGNHLIDLAAYLKNYRDWLIENEIVKPIEP